MFVLDAFAGWQEIPVGNGLCGDALVGAYDQGWFNLW
jgi:hypothetical protein